MSGTLRYVRIRGDSLRVVHRADCPMITRSKHREALPWAEGKHFEELVATLRRQGLPDHFCRVCFPRPDPR